MWEWFKKSWVFIILQIGLLPLTMIWLFGKYLLNRKIEIRRIDPEIFDKTGDVKFDNKSITAKFFWTKRTFFWNELTKITCFSEEFKREEYRNVIECSFYRGVIILFAVENKNSSKLINFLTTNFSIGYINWNTILLEEEKNKLVIFNKN